MGNELTAREVLSRLSEEERESCKRRNPAEVFERKSIDVPIVGNPTSPQEEYDTYREIAAMLAARDKKISMQEYERLKEKEAEKRREELEAESRRNISNAIGAQKHRRLKRTLGIALPIATVAAIIGSHLAFAYNREKQEEEINKRCVDSNVINGYDMTEEELRDNGLTNLQISQWSAFEENVNIYKELMARYSKDENSLTVEEFAKLKTSIDEILLLAKRNNQLTLEGKLRADSLSDLEEIYRIMIKAPIAKATGVDVELISTEMGLFKNSVNVGNKKYTELCPEYDYAITAMVNVLQNPQMSFDDLKSARENININDIVKCYEIAKLLNQGELVIGEDSIYVVSLELNPSTEIYRNVEMNDDGR